MDLQMSRLVEVLQRQQPSGGKGPPLSIHPIRRISASTIARMVWKSLLPFSAIVEVKRLKIWH